MDDFVAILRGMLGSKEAVVRALVEDINTCQRTQAGCAKIEANWDDLSPDDQKKQLLTAIKTNRRLADILTRVSMLMLVYTGSTHFTGDAAQMMSKLGHGQEALRMMFKAKMRGE